MGTKIFDEVIQESSKISDFYRDISNYVAPSSWSTIREGVAKMMVLEDDITSGKLNESTLLEYERATEFMTSLRERGISDLSDEDRDYYNKNIDKFKASGKFRAKDSYKQRMAKMRKMLDDGRDVPVEDEMPPQIEAKLDNEVENIVNQAIQKKDGQGGLSRLKSLIADKAKKFGGVTSDFLKKHAKKIKVLTSIGAAAIGVAKVVPLFLPFGPAGWVVGVVLGVTLGLLTKKAAIKGSQLGKDKLAPLIIRTAQEQAAKAKNPILKTVWLSLVGPRGKAVVEILCTIIGGVAGGAIVGGGGLALIRNLGPQLFQAFTAAVPDLITVAADPAMQAELMANAHEVQMTTESVPEPELDATLEDAGVSIPEPEPERIPPPPPPQAAPQPVPQPTVAQQSVTHQPAPVPSAPEPNVMIAPEVNQPTPPPPPEPPPSAPPPAQVDQTIDQIEAAPVSSPRAIFAENLWNKSGGNPDEFERLLNVMLNDGGILGDYTTLSGPSDPKYRDVVRIIQSAFGSNAQISFTGGRGILTQVSINGSPPQGIATTILRIGEMVANSA